MSRCKRTSAARGLAPSRGPRFRLLMRAAGLAALLAVAGCSADVTRFSFLGSAPPPAPTASPIAYAPPGASGRPTVVQETSLPLLNPPPPSQPPQLAKAPDGAPPPGAGPTPFPWPELAADKQKVAPGPDAAPGWKGRHVLQS